MDQRADRAMVVRGVFTTGRFGRRIAVVGRRLRAGERARAHARRRWRHALEMHVAERNRELERQRKQRQIRPQSRTRPEPTHRRHAARVSCPGRAILPVRACRPSTNVTLPRFGPSRGSGAIHLACCKKSSLGMRMPDRSVQFLRRRAGPMRARQASGRPRSRQYSAPLF